MLHTFEGWFCSAKLLDFPFFAIALFCTVQFWKHRVSICVSVTCKSLKQSHMNLKMHERDDTTVPVIPKSVATDFRVQIP